MKKRTRSGNAVGSSISRSKRKANVEVKYAESSDEEDEGNEENYEPVVKQAKPKMSTRQTKRRSEEERAEDINRETNTSSNLAFEISSARPLLSESESSDDDVNIVQLQQPAKKETQKGNELTGKGKGSQKRSNPDPQKLKDKKAIKSPGNSNFDDSDAHMKHDKCSGGNTETKPKLTNKSKKLSKEVRQEKNDKERVIEGGDIGSAIGPVSTGQNGKGQIKLDGNQSGIKPLKKQPKDDKKTTQAKKVPEKMKKRKNETKMSKGAVKGGSGKIIDKSKEVSDDIDDFIQLAPKTEFKGGFSASDSDDSENEWEDVHEADVSKSIHDSPGKKSKKDAGVKDLAISLKVKSIHKTKSEKNRELFLKYIERTMRRFYQQQKTDAHKCHLLCLVARARFLNNQSNNEILQAFCLSTVPWSITRVPSKKWDIQHLTRVVTWFQTEFNNTESLATIFTKDSNASKDITRVQIIVALLRSLGFLTRIVMSLQPLSPKVETLFRVKSSDAEKKTESNKCKPETPAKEQKRETVEDTTRSKASARKKNPNSDKNVNEAVSPYFKKGTEELQGKKQEKNKDIEKERSNAKGNTRKTSKNNTRPTLEVSNSTKSKTPLRSKRKRVSYTESDAESGIETEYLNEASQSDDDFVETPKRSLAMKLSHKVNKNIQSSAKKIKNSDKSTSPGTSYEAKLVQTIDNDEEFEKSSKPLSKKKSKNNKTSPGPVKVLSSDTEEEEHDRTKKKKKLNVTQGIDMWLEIYLTSMKKWVCIELSGSTVDDVTNCEKLATQPLHYVIGIDNDNSIKDVTCRYASKFMSKTRKLRIEREWWAETLQPYTTSDKKMEDEEDAQLRMVLLQQPFPKTIAEFKNHPLYVVEGDLLKFEGLYPESPAVLGYIRGKAIYSRDCVHILHTRENWLKEARVVKKGETAYKIVKGRPKRNTPVHERDKVKIDLFGLWQTEVYKPPPVKNGKVPRNEYGNVELFQPSMLPPGSVHIPIQGIQKVARKLDIDAAPAMMGWDFHSGCAHPIIEGVVVAKEFKEKLLDAWQKEEDDIAKKKKEKQEKKVLERWKLLVKGMLVRERIKRKYDFREHHEIEQKPNEDHHATEVSVHWPLNKMEGTTSVNDQGHCHIFPESGHKQDKITGEWTKSCACGLTMPFEKL